MADSFLDSLYKEEESLYGRIMSNPLIEDFRDIQRLIIKRGGEPKFILGYKDLENGLQVVAEIINKAVSKGTQHKDYDKSWLWDGKTDYALKKLGRSTPKEIIDFICLQEEVRADDSRNRTRISGNIYNALSRMNRDSLVTKEVDSYGTWYELKKNEAPSKDEASSVLGSEPTP